MKDITLFVKDEYGKKINHKVYFSGSDIKKNKFYVLGTIDPVIGEVLHVFVFNKQEPIENIRIKVFYSESNHFIDFGKTDSNGLAKFYLQKGIYDLQFTMIEDDRRYLRFIELDQGLNEFDISEGDTSFSGTLYDKFRRRTSGYVRLFLGHNIKSNQFIDKDGYWSVTASTGTVPYRMGLQYNENIFYSQTLENIWELRFDNYNMTTLRTKLKNVISLP